MIEPKETRPIEEKIAVVDEWFQSFDAVSRSEGEIAEIDPQLLRDVLIHHGAEFDPNKEGFTKLKQSTNKWRRPGMDAVWGKDFMKGYNSWTKEWADEYESRTGRSLTRLGETGNRLSGMRHWLGELTAYAAEAVTFEAYKEREEARLRNGYASSEGKPKEEVTFLAEGKKFPGSIPPGFVNDAWDKVKSTTLKNPD